jgi:hypothetical protein
MVDSINTIAHVLHRLRESELPGHAGEAAAADSAEDATQTA